MKYRAEYLTIENGVIVAKQMCGTHEEITTFAKNWWDGKHPWVRVTKVEKV